MIWENWSEKVERPVIPNASGYFWAQSNGLDTHLPKHVHPKTKLEWLTADLTTEISKNVRLGVFSALWFGSDPRKE